MERMEHRREISKHSQQKLYLTSSMQYSSNAAEGKQQYFNSSLKGKCPP